MKIKPLCYSFPFRAKPWSHKEEKKQNKILICPESVQVAPGFSTAGPLDENNKICEIQSKQAKQFAVADALSQLKCLHFSQNLLLVPLLIFSNIFLIILLPEMKYFGRLRKILIKSSSKYAGLLFLSAISSLKNLPVLHCEQKLNRREDVYIVDMCKKFVNMWNMC